MHQYEKDQQIPVSFQCPEKQEDDTDQTSVDVPDQSPAHNVFIYDGYMGDILIISNPIGPFNPLDSNMYDMY